jgi:hypothetical protein
MDRANVLEKEPLSVASVDPFSGRVDDGSVLHVDHRMRNIALSCNLDGLTDGSGCRREDDVPRDQNNLVQPFQTAFGGRIHF